MCVLTLLTNMFKKLWLKIKGWGKKFWGWVLAGIVGVTITANLAGIPPKDLTEQDVLDRITEHGCVFTKDASKLMDLSNSPFSNVTIHEYKAPDGAGCQIFLTKVVGTVQRETASGSGQFNAVNITQTKSVGYGPEAQYRNYDWE